MLRSGKLIPKKGGSKRFKSTRGRNLPELTEKEGGEAVILLSLPFTLIYPEHPLSFILTGFRKMLNTLVTLRNLKIWRCWVFRYFCSPPCQCLAFKETKIVLKFSKFKWIRSRTSLEGEGGERTIKVHKDRTSITRKNKVTQFIFKLNLIALEVMVDWMKGSRWWLKGLVPLSSLHFNWTSSQPPSSDETIAIKVFLFLWKYLSLMLLAWPYLLV